jgi:hypothetical protein
MDPNAALNAIREAITEFNKPDTESEEYLGAVDDLIDNFNALDEWLGKGGFLPTAWHQPQPTQEKENRMSTNTNNTEAQQAFDRLTTQQKADLAEEVFATLEYNEDGNPGPEWNADMSPRVGQVFERYGVTFTDPSV